MKLYRNGAWSEVGGIVDAVTGLCTLHTHDFDSDFGGSTIEDKYEQVINGDQTSVVDDPVLGSSRQVLRIDAQEEVLADGKVRVQMVEGFNHQKGEDLWVGFGVHFASDFPTVPIGGWFMFYELHGAPFAGGSPNGLFINSADEITMLGMNADYFTTPMVRGAWLDFAILTRLATKAHLGFAEVWMNSGSGWTQLRAKNGALRRRYRTIDTPNADGFCGSMIKHYRAAGMAGWATEVQHFAEHRTGDSFASVAPGSY